MTNSKSTFITLLHFRSRKKWFYFLIAFFFLSIFISSCSRRCSLSTDEQEKVTGFFEELLLEHGGAYTLFGSKPVTMEPLLDLSEANLQKIRTFLKQHPEIETCGEVERKFEEGWNIWKNRGQPCCSFILKEIDLNGNSMLVFMNEKATADVLLKYYEDFKQILGNDFNPGQEIAAFRKKNTEFWHKLLLDHKAKGILFGYGYANATRFCKECRQASGPSENNDPRLKAECTLNNKPFRIPIFAILDPAESQQLIQKYKQERAQIKKMYEGQDFLAITLDRLTLKKNEGF